MSNTYWSLGRTWFYDYNNGCFPSFNQILEGLLEELTRQIELNMANIDQLLVFEAKANLKETWEDLFSLVNV